MVWLIYHDCKPISAPELHIPMIQFLIKVISIYTLSALGDSSNLIGPVSSTMTLYSLH